MNDLGFSNRPERLPSGEATYSIGYARPPKWGQFEPGKSGNPKGRPKGSRNVWTELMEVCLSKVQVNDGGRPRHVSRVTAVLLTQWQRAVKGNERAAQAFFALAKSFGLIDQPKPVLPSEDLTDEMIKALKDGELDQLIELREKQEAILGPLRKRLHSPPSNDASHA